MSRPGLPARRSRRRITNGVSDSPDQFDLSTVVFQNGLSFNLDRLDASGISGIRNVAVEGSLVTTLSASGQRVLPLARRQPRPLTGGRLSADGRPRERLGPRLCPEELDRRRRNTGGRLRLIHERQRHRSSPALRRPITDASRLLGAGTRIVPAGSVNGQGTETFRVPFAALSGQQVAFFLDTASAAGSFDPKNMMFTLESDSDGVDPATLFPATRGAVTAMIGVNADAPGFGRAVGRPLRRRRIDLLGTVHRSVDHQHRAARRPDRAGATGPEQRHGPEHLWQHRRGRTAVRHDPDDRRADRPGHRRHVARSPRTWAASTSSSLAAGAPSRT